MVSTSPSHDHASYFTSQGPDTNTNRIMTTVAPTLLLDLTGWMGSGEFLP
ncbi:hypothetical protein [Paenibacillus lautus]